MRELFIELGRTRKRGSYKTYLTDYPGGRWVVLGRWPNSPRSQVMDRQDEYHNPEDAWQFARDLFAKFPDAVVKPLAYMVLQARSDSPQDPVLMHETRVPISSFAAATVAATSRDEELDDNSPLFVETRDVNLYLRKSRPNQDQFKELVFDRYGQKCAFCDIEEHALLDAAHIVPWVEMGADIPGNGLALCALHHRAFDADLVRIEPASTALVVRDAGPSLRDLHIDEVDLTRLKKLPRIDALQARWAGDRRKRF